MTKTKIVLIIAVVLFLTFAVSETILMRAQNSSSSASNGSGAPTGACISGSSYIDSSTGNGWACTGSAWQKTSSLSVLVGTTGSIGGSLLTAGLCSTGTVSITGATPGMPVVVSASDGTNIPVLGADISGTVTSSGTVTVSVCAIVSLTPTSKTYNVRVIP